MAFSSLQPRAMTAANAGIKGRGPLPPTGSLGRDGQRPPEAQKRRRRDGSPDEANDNNHAGKDAVPSSCTVRRGCRAASPST
jgi:hypothetical protein